MKFDTQNTSNMFDRIIRKINSVPEVYNTSTFEEMKSSLIEWLSSQDEFKDVNFVGARINVLLDILVYSMLYIQHFSNAALMESFIQTAVRRSSVIQHAQDKGYFVSGKKAAYTEVMLKCTHQMNPTSLRIPKNTKFLGVPSLRPTTTQPFVTMDDTIVIKDKDGFYYPVIKLYQGRILRTELKFDPSKRIIIYDDSIDRDKVRVWVDNVEWADWTTKPIVETTGTSNVFYMREDIDGNTEIYFGEGVKSHSTAGGALESNYIGGLKPIGGSNIVIEYLRTNGSLGNSSTEISYADTLPNIIVHEVIENHLNDRLYSGASGGGDAETVERIREHATLKQETQRRCVTNSDYDVFVMEKFGPIIQSIKTFTDRTKPSYAFIAIKPRDGLHLSTTQKEDIKNYLEGYNISAITPVPISPNYLFIKQKVKVTYDLNKLEGTEQWLSGKVIEKIADYYDNDVESFDKSFHVSRMLSFIDKADLSILGSTAEIQLVREIESFIRTPMVGISYDNKIEHGSVYSSLIEFSVSDDESYDVQVISTKPVKNGVGDIVIGPFRPEDIDPKAKPYTGSNFTKPSLPLDHPGTAYYKIGTINHIEDNISWDMNSIGITQDQLLVPSIELFSTPVDDNIFVRDQSMIVFENDLRPEYTEIIMEAIAQ